MKKIVYLSDVDISSPGGAQESMKILLNELSNQYDFYLITPSGTKINENHYVLNRYENFIVRGKKIIDLIMMSRDISKAIKKIKPDIIHIQMPSTLVVMNILISLKLIRNVKIVYTDRGVYGLYGKVTTFSINSLINKANKIITTTNHNLLNYKKTYKKFHENSGKFEVIYNTAGKSFDIYTDEKRQLIREKYKIEDDRTVIGFCGRFSPQKDWALATEIIEKCSNEFNDYVYMLVIGTDGTQKNMDEVIKYCEDLKGKIGEDKVKIYINLNINEVEEVYYAMDCFILTSKWESFGRTAVEAMARKNIVIGRNVDGLSEVIGNSEYLYSHSDELLNILRSKMCNYKEILKTKELFYKRYHNYFGYRSNIKAYNNLYEKI